MKYQFIREAHVRYSVTLQCAVLKVSRAGYYQWRTQDIPKRERENATLLERMRELHAKHKGRYGSPRMIVAL